MCTFTASIFLGNVQKGFKAAAINYSTRALTKQLATSKWKKKSLPFLILQAKQVFFMIFSGLQASYYKQIMLFCEVILHQLCLLFKVTVQRAASGNHRTKKTCENKKGIICGSRSRHLSRGSIYMKTHPHVNKCSTYKLVTGVTVSLCPHTAYVCQGKPLV